MEPETSQVGRSRRWGILCISGAVGYIATFTLIARVADTDGRVDALAAAAFGFIPLAIGIGYLIDAYLHKHQTAA